ncbi:MAG TPA: hypothetical protein VFO36_08465, partial [Nitrospiraceae bacterium]|nr:hypothetical protein [Nitrospiraceae bacterium]
MVSLAYDGLCTFEFGCVVEVFALHRPEVPMPWYEFAVWGIDNGPLRALGGVHLQVPRTRGLLARA